jgi:hypothetical protein
MQRALQTVLLLLLPLFASGCVTHKLWTESALDEWNEPAPNPNLRLFNDPRRHDFLVMYDEYSERHTRTRTRAFFLNLNQDLRFQHLRPHYVRLDNAFGLQPLPVFHQVPLSPPAGFCVVTTTNAPAYALFSNGREIGSYELPVYNDGVGQAERMALTPVAVTIDATIVGGAAGCLCLYLYALGQGDFQSCP